jgi:hypothetical protein
VFFLFFFFYYYSFLLRCFADLAARIIFRSGYQPRTNHGGQPDYQDTIRAGRGNFPLHWRSAGRRRHDTTIVGDPLSLPAYIYPISLLTTRCRIVLVQWNEFTRPTIRQVGRGLTIPTNLGLFIFGFVFQLLFMCDALRLRSTAQAILACLLNPGFLAFAVLQRSQTRQDIDSLMHSTDSNGEALVNVEMDIWSVIGKLLLAIPFIVGACMVLLFISVWYLKEYFSWQSYRNVGADAKLRKMRITQQVFLTQTPMKRCSRKSVG